MSLTYNSGLEKDLFVWTTPNFKSAKQCQEWVQNNNDQIYFKLMEEFPNDKVDKLFCVNEKKLELFFQSNQGTKVRL